MFRKLFRFSNAHTEVNDRPDIELIQRVINGDIDSYEPIMRRYNQRLFRVARSILLDDDYAMDAVQETHIKAYQQLANFTGDNGFAAWLSVIARNQALMALRKLKADKTVSYQQHDLEQAEIPTMKHSDGFNNEPDKQVENQQLRQQLCDQIDTLPEVFRTVFMMRGIEQLSVRETALILDIKEATVKSRFFRAKALLQERITKEYGTDLYEIGGSHCDKIVHTVLTHIRNN